MVITPLGEAWSNGVICKAGVLRQLAEGPATRLRLMRALEPLDWQPLVTALSWPPVSPPLCAAQNSGGNVKY